MVPEQQSPQTENIEIEGSHCGLGHNPLVLFAIADRLAQQEGQWWPFERRGVRALVYPDPLRRRGLGAQRVVARPARAPDPALMAASPTNISFPPNPRGHGRHTKKPESTENAVVGDLSKLVEQFKLPGVDINAIVEAQRKDMEALAEANRVAYEGIKALAARRNEILKDALTQWREAMQDVAGQDAMSKAADTARQRVQQAMANFRELAQIEAQARNKAWKVVQDRFQEKSATCRSCCSRNSSLSSARLPARRRATVSAIFAVTQAVNRSFMQPHHSHCRSHVDSGIGGYPEAPVFACNKQGAVMTRTPPNERRSVSIQCDCAGMFPTVMPARLASDVVPSPQ